MFKSASHVAILLTIKMPLCEWKPCPPPHRWWWTYTVLCGLLSKLNYGYCLELLLYIYIYIPLVPSRNDSPKPALIQQWLYTHAGYIQLSLSYAPNRSIPSNSGSPMPLLVPSTSDSLTPGSIQQWLSYAPAGSEQHRLSYVSTGSIPTWLS